MKSCAFFYGTRFPVMIFSANVSVKRSHLTCSLNQLSCCAAVVVQYHATLRHVISRHGVIQCDVLLPLSPELLSFFTFYDLLPAPCAPYNLSLCYFCRR